MRFSCYIGNVKHQRKELNRLEGVISISAKGTGYVKIPDRKEDVEIDWRHLATALHGDTVEITLLPKVRGRDNGEVLRVISRVKSRFTGVLEQEDKLFFVRPDDTKMYVDIMIPHSSLNGAKPGQKVFAEITSWTDHRKSPEGKIIKILGRKGDNNAEMHAIALEKGFDATMPSKVELEAKKISAQSGPASGWKEECAKRRDFRNVLTFTIDPKDAKDFDDAISFRVLPSLSKEGVGGGKEIELYEVGVHIADVSHYVQPESALDSEARERGTSVYLVDRTIPMLPEVLSNDLCSLVPGENRLTMSAIFKIDRNAQVKEEWFGRTVIHSQKRFTYEEAEDTIKNPQAPLHKELALLNNMAKQLTSKRFAQGAISLDQEEVRFVLGPDGTPLKVEKKERGDSHRLIEEFMLLANKKVAQFLSPKESPHRRSAEEAEKNISIYRIHDEPSKEKMADLAVFLQSLGLKVHLVNGIIPSHDINKMLAGLTKRDDTLADTVHRAIIRSMAKAIYSTKNIGHYGLAFQYYTHFTSPIRRYPDIVVHRLLEKKLAGKKIPGNKLLEYEKMALVASEQEKRAADAERASIKYKQVEYMSRFLGKNFNGIISGITEWGMYVEEEDTKCEGLVRVRDMNDDFYVFDEKKLSLIGQKTKVAYRLGDRVKIKVKDADLERKTIDYVLA